MNYFAFGEAMCAFRNLIDYRSYNYQKPAERHLPPPGRLSTVPSSIYSQVTPELKQDIRFPPTTQNSNAAAPPSDEISLSSSPPASREGVYVAGDEISSMVASTSPVSGHLPGSPAGMGPGLGLGPEVQSGTVSANNDDEWQHQQQMNSEQNYRRHISIPKINTSTNGREPQQQQQQQTQTHHTRKVSAGPMPWEALGSNSPVASPKLNSNNCSNNNSPQFPAYAFSNSYTASPSPEAFGVVTSIYSTKNVNSNKGNDDNPLKKLGNRRGSPKLGAISITDSGSNINAKSAKQRAPREEWKGASGRYAIMEIPTDRPPAPPAKDGALGSPMTPKLDKLFTTSSKSAAPLSSQSRKKPSPIITSGGAMGIVSPVTATNIAVPQIYSTPQSASTVLPSSTTTIPPPSSIKGVKSRKPVPTATRVAGLLTPTSPNTTYTTYPCGSIYNNGNHTSQLSSPANANLTVDTGNHSFTQAGIPANLPLATPTPRSAAMLTQFPAVVKAFTEPHSPSSPLAEIMFGNGRSRAGSRGRGDRDVSPLGNNSRPGGEMTGVSPLNTPIACDQRQNNGQNNRYSWDNSDDNDNEIKENPVQSRFSWSTHATGTTRQSTVYSPSASPAPPLPDMDMNNINQMGRSRNINFNCLDIDMTRISNLSESMIPAPLSVGSADGTKNGSTGKRVVTAPVLPSASTSQLMTAQALLGSTAATMSPETRSVVGKSARQSSLPNIEGKLSTGTGAAKTTFNNPSTSSSSSPSSTAAAITVKTSNTILSNTNAKDTKSKALPLSPPEQLASGDLITTLEAQLDDFRIRRRNIEKCIQKNEGMLNGTVTGTATAAAASSTPTSITNTPISTPSPISNAGRKGSGMGMGIDLSLSLMTMSQRRSTEAQIKSFKDELDEIGRSEHEVGLRLHRAWKRERQRGEMMEGLGLDGAAAGAGAGAGAEAGKGGTGGSWGWETGIWVRRVTG